MNEITIRGNLTKAPELRRSGDGVAVLNFTVAVNGRRWFDQAKQQWVGAPAVFHNVVCFKELADNAAETLRKGMAVTVTGEFADDSFTPQGSDYPVRRIKLRAYDVATSLRNATAVVSKVDRSQGETTEVPESAASTQDARELVPA